jgi:hypothetical protein
MIIVYQAWKVFTSLPVPPMYSYLLDIVIYGMKSHVYVILKLHGLLKLKVYTFLI